MTLVERLQRGWYGSASPPLSLRLLAGVYGTVVRTRRALYRRGVLHSEQLPVPVVVIGNLSVGGTGKTPLTIALAAALRDRGWSPGVVSRGHGRGGRETRWVREGDSASEVGDEPLLIAASGVPVAVAARRADAGRLLIGEAGCDLLLADDGLQHYALARDVEVLVIDGRRGYGNGALLPAGPLREPPERAGQCDLVVVNGGSAEPPAHAMQLVIEHALPLHGGAAPVPLQEFAGRRVHAVAGIGDPRRFFDALRGFGIELVEHAFPDHHPFVAEDLHLQPDLPLLMTEKDAVKCRAFARPGWYAVPARALLPEGLVDALCTSIKAAMARRGGFDG